MICSRLCIFSPRRKLAVVLLDVAVFVQLAIIGQVLVSSIRKLGNPQVECSMDSRLSKISQLSTAFNYLC
jgi:hypothetical protein